jgi:DNA-directed RNA polymerase subunit RPC12/RpoP
MKLLYGSNILDDIVGEVFIMITTGSIVQQSGIYKCTKCSNEITCVKGERVPPCRKCSNTSFRLVRATR